jgi:hypothetical protein
MSPATMDEAIAGLLARMYRVPAHVGRRQFRMGMRRLQIIQIVSMLAWLGLAHLAEEMRQLAEMGGTV